MGKPDLLATATLFTLGAIAWSAAHASGLPPTVGGTPATSATTGTLYDFRPTSSDPEGDTLAFTITGRPAWAYYNNATGRLYGTPPAGSSGTYGPITIKVSDGTSVRSLPAFTITVKAGTSSPEAPSASRKANYGHYFATRYQDTPDDVAMLCEQHGVEGVMIRQAWSQLESTPGTYDFSYVDAMLRAIAASRNPSCQIWFMPEFKSFNASPVRHPAPAYLVGYQALNADGKASTLFMWDPYVQDRYVALMRAIATRYDSDPRFEGFVIQESALGFNGKFTQDEGTGGTYTAAKWRDALIRFVGTCGSTFKQSRCMSFLNFLKDGQQYLHDVSAAISAVPDNRACLSGPDLLPDARAFYRDGNGVYEVLARHKGCRANSAQNDSFEIYRFGLDDVFNFAVRGTHGDFDQAAPRASGVCVNSYLFWNHRVGESWSGLDWHDVLPVIAAYPYGRLWLDQCVGSTSAP